MVEWIAYHQSIGFDHFFIYGNDDDYRTLADALAPFIVGNLVTFVHCPEVGAQKDMYLHFLNHYLHQCEWISFLDHDEFFRLDGFGNRIENLTRRAHEYDSIQFNWICYGTSGFEQRPRGSVLRQYTKREVAVNLHTKHLTRASAFYRNLFPSVDSALWLHFPFWHTLPTVSLPTCSTLFEPVSSVAWHQNGEARVQYEDYLRTRSDALLAQATVAHFSLKSRADFERRITRSTCGNFVDQSNYIKLVENREAQDAYIANGNAVEDFYLAAYWDAYIRSCAHSAPFQWESARLPTSYIDL